MKKVFLSAVSMAVSINAFASAPLTCKPASDNSYFTDDVKVEAISAKQISVNGTKLTLDNTYKPRNPTGYQRFKGDTETASQWSDSGDVQIFYDGASRLKFTVRGEMFISETFTCSSK